LGFSVHKLESDIAGNTLLIIGGIQGDEPGGFNAASLIVTHYEIHSGNVWVVPINATGVYIKGARKIKPDNEARVIFAIPGNDGPFKLQGKIVRTDQTG